MKQLTIRLDDESSRDLRIRVLQYDTSIQAVVVDALKKWLEEHPAK